jgi:23S rRNA pseudouridine1911/1915/1917 synthase
MRQQVLATSQAGGQVGFQEAITHFEVLAEYSLSGGKGFISKLRLRLETGLKHQIRIQAAQAGVPLVGDRTYNPSYSGRTNLGTKVPFPRQALHAAQLELEHPEKAGQRMNWTAPSEDLRQLEVALKRQV